MRMKVPALMGTILDNGTAAVDEPVFDDPDWLSVAWLQPNWSKIAAAATEIPRSNGNGLERLAGRLR